MPVHRLATVATNAEVVIPAFLTAEEGLVSHKNFVIDVVADFVSDSDSNSDSVRDGGFGTVLFMPQLCSCPHDLTLRHTAATPANSAATNADDLSHVKMADAEGPGFSPRHLS